MCLDDLFYYESSDNVLKNEKKSLKDLLVISVLNKIVSCNI